MLLFADDILLQASTYTEIKNILKIVGNWLMANEMNVNHQKSGFMDTRNTSPETLSIQNLPIPSVKYYKYLGFTFHKARIEFEKSSNERVENATKLLYKLKSFENQWNIYAKLMIYKTYIAPAAEYGLGITYHWINANYRNRHQVYEPLETLLYESIKWITGLRKHKRVIISILGLCDSQQRSLEHAYRLTIQLRNSDKNNPISNFQSMSNSVLNSNRLAARCFRNTIFNPDKKLSYKEMRAVYLENLNSEMILPACILNRSRALFDPVINFKDDTTRRAAILWRNNLLYHKRECPVCFKPFHRTHINECNIFDLKNERLPYWDSMPASYNYLDHLLNTGKELEFKRLIFSLTRYLVPRPSNQMEENTSRSSSAP